MFLWVVERSKPEVEQPATAIHHSDGAMSGSDVVHVPNGHADNQPPSLSQPILK
jgi:hypothetical protein